MATLITKSADINILDANGWNSVETGTRAIQNSHSASTTTTTSTVFNADAQDITGTNLNVCDGLLMFCNQSTSTGTVKVVLSADSGTTETRAVTVNATDLPTGPSWVFFKFGSTLTLDGGTDYAVGIQGSSAANATFFRDATTANWSHLLRLTATVTAAAGDVLYIVGDHTGAGATTARVVTMTDTASTDFGTAVAGTSDNGIDIGDAGTLTFGTAAATNYTLKVSGGVSVWGGGTLSIGTTGTPIPRGSTATLNFDCGANVDYGLIVAAGGTFNAQALSRTSGKNIFTCKLNTDEAANSTSLGVDTDTGWLDNDVIAVASTTRTASQSESGTLNGDAGASSLTVDGFGGTGGGLANAHSGTSPTQAEVVLLTRSIVIQGASSSLQSYIQLDTTSVTDCDWVEFKWMGASGTFRGIVVNTSTGSASFHYCSRHSSTVTSSQGWRTVASNASNITISNCVSFNVAAEHLAFGATTGTWTVENNVFIRNADSSVALVSLGDVGGTYTNNTTVSATGPGVSFTEAAVAAGTFSGITSHSNTGIGLNFSAGRGGSLSNVTCWRNTGTGISTSSPAGDYIFTTVLLFGNTTSNISLTGYDVTFIDLTSAGDSTFSTTNGFTAGTASSAGMCYFYNSTFGDATGIYVAHTQDILCSANMGGQIILNNCKLASSTEVSTNSSLDSRAIIGSQKHDQTAGSHKSWKKYGTITIDTTANMYRTASPSERLTPNNASSKLVSGSFKVNVNSGQTCTPSVYVRESVAGDGTDYNGARPRLILKRNDAIGVTADSTVDTATVAAEGAFEQLTGTTAAATDDGVMEFIIDCDGTTGWVNVDDITATVA